MFLNYEDAVYFLNCPVAGDVERDFRETLKSCEAVTYETLRTIPWGIKLAGRILRLIAPLF